jgi:type III secretion system-like peptide-binding chaperone/TIR domain-containing protein
MPFIHAVMADVFICHVEENEQLAAALAEGLEKAGVSCWYYERDSYPGPSYLVQTGDAIESCKAVVVLISSAAFETPLQMRSEIIQAYEAGKSFVPLLVDVTVPEFHERQPEWRRVIGSATAVRVPEGGASALMERLLKGLRSLGISEDASPLPPSPKPTATLDQPQPVNPQLLAGSLAWMQEQDQRFVIVEVIDSDYYVQFATEPGEDRGIYGEAVSNAHLPSDKRLTPEQQSQLVQRGWVEPADADSNFSRMWIGTDHSIQYLAAAEAIETLQTIYGVSRESLKISTGN